MHESVPMARRFIPLLLSAVLALGGCAQYRARTDVFEASQNAPYTLASGDRLRIIVFGQDNLSNVYAVDSVGSISFPLVGKVHAGGLTTQGLEREIEARLRAGYLREPRVSVEVEQYRPFFILGEVTQSGQYPYVNGMTVQTAVAIAGGFSPRAAQSVAELTRSANGEVIVGTVPITFPVRPGDTLVIKERYF